MMARTGRECRLEAVGVDAGYHVECTRPQCLDHDIDAAIVPHHQILDQVQRRHARRDLRGMDVGVYPMSTIVQSGSSRRGNGREEQASAGMTRTVRF